MGEGTKTATLIFLGLVTIWDGFTTVSGTLETLGNSTFGIILSVLCAIFVSGILVYTVPIISNPKDDILTLGSKGLWIVCLVYDSYTAFIGNTAFTSTGVEGKGLFVLILMTIITVTCPITISYILYRKI